MSANPEHPASTPASAPALTLAVEPVTAPGIGELLQASSDFALAHYPPENAFLLAPEELADEDTDVLVARRDGLALGMVAIVGHPGAADDDSNASGIAGDPGRPADSVPPEAPAHPGYAEFKRFVVAEAGRGLGIGTVLLAAAEERARERGFRDLRLETGPFNDSALRLYERAGWHPIEAYGAYLREDLRYSLFFGKTLED